MTGAGGQTLYVRLAVGLGDLTAGLARGSAQITAFGARTDAQMARLEGWGKRNEKQLHSLGTVAGGVGLAAAAGIGFALKRYADFDAQMSKVQAATHATREEMAALRAEAIKQGADTQFSAVEAGQGIEELAKAGVGTAEILGGGLKGALDLAAAGSLEVGTAAEIAATAMTQFRLSGDQIPHLADLLAAGAGKAQGGVTDLGSALQQSGLIASGMGLSIEDTTGTLAAFASAGMLGSDAGTSFKTMLQRLQSPIGQSKKAFEQWGISAYDTEGNFVGITDVAEQLRQKLGGLDQQTRDAALTQMFGADAIRAATVLYRQGGEGIQSWIDKTNDAGYAAETARLKTDNLAGDLERLGGSLDSFLIGMGSGGNGPARELVQLLEAIVDVAGAVPAPMMGAAAAGLLLTAALGGTAFAATRMIGAVGATRANLAFLRAEVQRTTASVVAMDRAQLGMRVGKGVAGLTGLALAASSVGDGFALTNTATYALMGTMGGPLGIAAGVAVGAFMDIRAESDRAGASLAALKKEVGDVSDFDAQSKAIEKATTVQEALRSTSGGMFDDQADELEKAVSSAEKYRGALQSLEDQAVGGSDGVNELFDTAKMTDFANRVGPMLQKIGLDLNDVLAEGPTGENWGAAVAAIQDYTAEADSAAGRTGAVGDAVSGLDSDLSSAAESADGLAKALQGLLSPNMDLDRATIAWRESLRGLNEDLAKGNRELLGTSAGADQNRAAVMDLVDALMAQVTAAAKAGESSEQIATRLAKGRQAIIDTGVAADFSAGEMEELLTQYDLTPELVQTIIEAVGAEGAKNDLDSVGDSADGVDNKAATPTVNRPAGAGRAMNDLSSVGGAVDTVDGKSAHPFVLPNGVPNALRNLGSVGDKVISVGGLSANPKVSVGGNWRNALGGLATLGRQIDSLANKNATSNVTVNRTTVNRSVHKGSTVEAFGSFKPGLAGGPGILPRYAQGGFSGGKSLAHIARAGVPRGIYAEPETQGESFIPHAMDRRRRSTQILGMTAAKFGYDLAPRGMEAAGGGTTNVTHHAAPLIGGDLVIQGGTRQQVMDSMDIVEARLRRAARGGKPS